MIERIEVIGGPSKNPDNDNVDVHVHLNDGRTFSFLVATPENALTSMEKEGSTTFITWPPALIVRRITEDVLQNAFEELCSSDRSEMLSRYGVLQE
jgi:hypothetical protein